MTFKMWSLFHILLLLSPFIFATVLYYFTKKNSEKTNRKIGLILSIICIIILILRNYEILKNSGFKVQPEVIPFQICHFANFVLLFAFLFKNKTMFSVAFCFNLPFALMSIIFANSLENYSTIINFRGFAYIVGHMLIVGITVWALLAGFVKITKQTLIRSIIFILSLFVISVPINNIFNKLMPNYESNYFYTLTPEGGTPLELAFNWGKNIQFLGMTINFVYIIITAIFGIAIFFGFYILYRLYEKKIKSL